MTEKEVTREEFDDLVHKVQQDFAEMCFESKITDDQKIGIMTGKTSINSVRKELGMEPLDGDAYDMLVLFDPGFFEPCLSADCFDKVVEQMNELITDDRNRYYLGSCLRALNGNQMIFFSSVEGSRFKPTLSKEEMASCKTK